MGVSILFRLACAAALIVGSQVSAQTTQSESYVPPAAPAPATTPALDPSAPTYQPVDPGYIPPPITPAPADVPAPVPPVEATTAAPAQQPCPARPAASAPDSQGGIQQQDALAAAEGVFGKGAKGLAGLIEKIFKDRGQPIGYIAGREAGGAFIVGVRYGSGILCHKIEGDRKVYWTGPSVGFDAGADANKVFVLVYNLHDTQELFRRYPSTEGHAYLVGGFSASVLQRSDVILVPIRLGVGLRLGVNAGYMNFSAKSRWLPF
jgi:hypothetical protein